MKRLVLALLAAVTVAGLPVLADEIVHFKNGTAMPIVSHEVDGDMIRVVLDGGSTMGFPLEQVDRVEDAQGKVVSSGDSFNQAVPRVPDPTSGGRQTASAPSRYKRGEWEGQDVAQQRGRPGVERDPRGLAAQRPFGDTEHSGKRKMMTNGNRSIFSQPPVTSRKDGIVGTSPRGNTNAFPSAGGSRRPQATGIAQRPGN
jgi:hypothetical protein